MGHKKARKSGRFCGEHTCTSKVKKRKRMIDRDRTLLFQSYQNTSDHRSRQVYITLVRDVFSPFGTLAQSDI